MSKSDPIGVFDSGVGGLTLLPSLMKLCPGEDIVYYGDSANCPYGNRSKEDLAALVGRILRFLSERKIKLVAIACNTTSSMLDALPENLGFPLVDIVTPVAAAVAASGIRKVGVFATEFTAASGVYRKKIQMANPDIDVYEKGSPNLAELVDTRAGNDDVDAEIRGELGPLLEASSLRHVILGCTHYPIVRERFEALYPNITYIDPVGEQAKTVARHLDEKDLRNPQPKGSLMIYTSGNPAVFKEVTHRLEIQEPACIETLSLNPE